jgi:hypothetical protein
MSKTQTDADLIALVERCEAAAKRYGLASDAFAKAEFASPHNEAEEAEAERVQSIALDELRDLGVSLARMQASTVDGLLAKAKALKFAFPTDDALAERLEEGLMDDAFDADPISLSLARDLLVLSNQKGSDDPVALSQATERALALWDQYRQQKERCHRLLDSSTEEESNAMYDVLFAIEHLLQADIGASVHALAVVLMIEIEDDEDNEHIPGFYRAALASMRSQLTGSIAEYADRVLAGSRRLRRRSRKISVPAKEEEART